MRFEPKSTVEKVIQAMMDALGKSIDFVEWNAPSIDEHMKTEGFHVQSFIDHETGFVHGGNVTISAKYDM